MKKLIAGLLLLAAQASHAYTIPYTFATITCSIPPCTTPAANLDSNFGYLLNLVNGIPVGTGVPVWNGTNWTTALVVGSLANNLVQLNGSAQLPAVSGALLTNLTAANISAGTAGIAITGNAATATALAATPTQCSAGNYPLGIAANGNAQNCTAAGSGSVTAVSVATANGFAGTSSGGSTPALTLTTTLSGIAYGNGTGFAAATGANINSTFGSQTANYVYAAPSGSSGNPAFRLLLSTDIPTLNQNTTGTAGGLTGTAITGDVTNSGNTFTLNPVNSNVGSYTNANITVNAKGLITAAANGTGGGGTTTNALTGNNSGTGAASGSTFNGAAAVSWSYNTFGAAALAGSASQAFSVAGLTLTPPNSTTSSAYLIPFQQTTTTATSAALAVNTGLTFNPNTGALGATSFTGTVAAANLTGTALASGIVTSSLTGAAGGAFGTGAYAAAYTLPTATSSVLGGVKPDNVTITNSAGAISCTTATTSLLGCVKPDNTTITISGGVITAVGGSATAITVGTTNVGSGTSGYVLYNNAGVLGNESTATFAPLTTEGDLYYYHTSANARLPIGANNTCLLSNATDPSWSTGCGLLAVAATWSAAQTFTNSDLRLLGTSTGYNTFTAANASATNYVTTVPAVTGTLITSGDTSTVTNTMLAGSIAASKITTGTSGANIPLLNGANTWSGVQTITNSDWCLLGSSTGCTTLTSANASATAYTVTVPAATDTMCLIAATQTLTNKSIAGSEVNSGTVAIANGGTGQATSSAAFNALSPITTTGDLIIGTGTNTASRLAIGSNTYVLTSNGTTAAWAASASGFTNPMTTQGDIIYGGTSGLATRLAGAGTNNYVLTYNTSTNAPFWAAGGGGGATLYTGSSSGSPVTPTVGAYLGQVAIGSSAAVSSTGTQGFAIGGTSANTCTGTGCMAIGYGATVAGSGNYAMALGYSYATGIGAFSAAIGYNGAGIYGALANYAIAIGNDSAASAVSTIAIGNSATASGTDAIALGINSSSGGTNGIAVGNQATASTAYGIGIGFNAYASVAGASAFGYNSSSAQIGKYEYAYGDFSSAGDAQLGQIILRAHTTGTAVVLTSDGNAAGNNQLVLVSNQSISFTGTCTAKTTATANSNGYMIEGNAVNNAGTVTITSSQINLMGPGAGTDAIGLTAGPTLTVDATNLAVQVTSGYKAATNINWVCTLQSSELTF